MIGVGDQVSVVGILVKLVICRGTIKEVIREDTDAPLATTDGLYYFYLNGCEKYEVVPKDETDNTAAEKFYFAFQHIDGINYIPLDDGGKADIYVNVDSENIVALEQSMVSEWNQMFPESKLTPSVRDATITIECSDSEFEDVKDLVTDPKNIFGKTAQTCEGHTFTFKLGDDLDILEKYESMERIWSYIDTLIQCYFRLRPEDDLLNYNNHGRRSFQWEVWAMCNNLCTYCYLGTENRHTDKERQMKSLNDLHKAIDSLDFRIYNNISLIGGDFFQGQIDEPEVHDSFMSLIEKCAKAYHEDKIGSMWITCTMTLGDQHHLYEMLDIFEKYECFPREKYSSSGIWLCTSWDIKGRFHTPDRLENWDYHMKNIHKKYPWVKFNTTIILMEDFCQAVIDGKWDARQFAEEYNTTLFFKQIGLGKMVDDVDLRGTEDMSASEVLLKAKQIANERMGFTFAPHRKTMLGCLRVFATKWPEMYDRLFNIQYRADELHRNFNDQMFDMKTRRNKNSDNETDVAMENSLNTCGHMMNYAPYVDSPKCCVCDKRMIWESINGA